MAEKSNTSVTSRARVTAGGIPVEILDLRLWVEGTGDSSGYERKWTVVQVTHQSILPGFRLAPRHGRAFRLFTWLAGIRDLEFVGHPVGEEFGRSYSLWPTAADQLAVRDLFTREVLEHFVSDPGWNVTSEGGEVRMWREDRVLAPDTRQAVAEGAVAVYRVLVQSTLQKGEVLEALAARSPELSSAMTRMLVLFLCGGAGGFLGFVLSALVVLALPAGGGWAKGVALLLLCLGGWVVGVLGGIRLVLLRQNRSRIHLPAPGVNPRPGAGDPDGTR